MAESKTVTLYNPVLNEPNDSLNPKLEVSFSAPAAPAPKKKTTTAAPVEVKPPDTLTTSAIETNGTRVTATGKTSARTTLAAFTVEEPVVTTVATQQTKPKTKNNLTGILAGALVTVLAAEGLVYWWLWKRKKQGSKDQTLKEPPDTNPEPPQDPPTQPDL